ncbi:MAG: tripartite tricarboxylate transporter substrate binding protein BugD, partial [Alphaproteobacteria bacterium]|nr:tripartite tricarboxylate transporter substrate binding protein BugD [Alphaproteobacteria bacterium]
APRNTPKEVGDKLAGALQAALGDPVVKQRFNDVGTEPVPAERATPGAASALLQSEIKRWAPVIRQAGQYAD